MTHLPQLRRNLAEAKVRLSHARADEQLARAQAEQRAIDAAGGNYGKNDSERARFLTLALAGDSNYSRARSWLHSCEQVVTLLEADIAATEDERRDREWQIRQQLADALSVRYVPTDSPDEFDQAADGELDELVDVDRELYGDEFGPDDDDDDDEWAEALAAQAEGPINAAALPGPRQHVGNADLEDLPF